MARRAKVALVLQFGSDNKPISGVGPGVGLEFVKAYFPEAQHTIRIASLSFGMPVRCRPTSTASSTSVMTS